MYSRLLDELSKQWGLSIAHLSMDAQSVLLDSPPSLNFSSEEASREFDNARLKWIREWRPRVVFLIDRWDSRSSTQLGFRGELEKLIAALDPLVEQIFFVAQVPALEANSEMNLRELVTWHYRTRGGAPTIKADAAQPLRQQAIEAATGLKSRFPKLEILRVDSPFLQSDGTVRYWEGRHFYYLDNDHLTDAGSEVVRSIFEPVMRPRK